MVILKTNVYKINAITEQNSTFWNYFNNSTGSRLYIVCNEKLVFAELCWWTYVKLNNCHETVRIYILIKYFQQHARLVDNGCVCQYTSGLHWGRRWALESNVYWWHGVDPLKEWRHVSEACAHLLVAIAVEENRRSCNKLNNYRIVNEINGWCIIKKGKSTGNIACNRKIAAYVLLKFLACRSRQASIVLER